MIISTTMLERRNIIRVFNEHKNHSIIAVCAPAGYGKTVAVTQWLNKDSRSKAIFSLDSHDNNLTGFCERFCAALCNCQPQNKTLAELIIHPSFESAPDIFTLRAVSALSSRKQAILAMDDLHLIQDNGVLQLLSTLIRRLPKNFQTVLISRIDLPPIFSDLRIKGQVSYISMDHFLFTSRDIVDLCKMRGGSITQEQAREISQQTQGWAIGINAFLLSGGESSDMVFGYLNDFVKAHIWERWDDTTRDFMIRTGGLRELSPSLCEALTNVPQCDNFIRELVKRGAFITQLKKGVYRYHHLFQQFLQYMAHERGEEFTNALLSIEGDWYLSQLNFYSAVDCFIRCKDHGGIAKCFDFLADSGNDNFTLGSLLPILKHPEFKIAAQKYPRLLFLLTWGAYADGRGDDMVSYMDEYSARYDEIVASYPSSKYKSLFMCIYDFRVSPSEMVNKIGALSVDPSELSISQWSVSMHMPMLHRGLKDYSEFATGNIIENCQTMQLKASWLLGKESAMLIQTLAAELLYEQGRLDEAYKCAIEAMSEKKSHFLTESNLCAMAIYACILDAAGETGADEVTRSISQMIEDTKSYHLSNNFNAFTTRREMASGNMKAAQEWLAIQSFDEPTLYGIYADFTTSRAYIAVEKYDLAIILLKKILGIASIFNRPLDIVEAQILLTIAHWKKKRGFQKNALEYLEDAVLIAYPYSYEQMFVNDGAELANILFRLQKRVEQRRDEDKKHINFIKMLYMKTRVGINTENAIEEKPAKYTDKQKTIMRLLAQGKRHIDIAGIMGVKRATVCAHLRLIYNKLGVATATDAIAKINLMELFHDDTDINN